MTYETELEKGKLYRFHISAWGEGSARLYAQPMTTNQIGTIPDKALVMFLKREDRNWHRVIYMDQVGWVWGYLEKMEEEQSS